MKNKTKKIAGLALSAALALSVGAGVYNVINAYEQPAVTASAETITKDLSNTIYNVNEYYNGDWGSLGDFKEAGLYRFWISKDKTLVWNEGGSSLNIEGNDNLLNYIKVNGKTIAQWRTEYEKGETNAITWEGMPGNLGGGNAMNEAIGNDVTDGGDATFAPIVANVAHHGGNYGSALDMYIPTSFISEVTSIEFLKGFEWSYNGEVFGFSENVYFGINSLGIPYKVVGERNFTVKETRVSGIDGTYGATDQFLSFFLSENDYGTDNTVALTDKDFLNTLNFFDYILIDGQKMGSLWAKQNPSEQFFNVWNRSGSISTRWPIALKNAGAVDTVSQITVLAGCQFPSKTDTNVIYETTEDITFTRQESGVFADPSTLIDADAISIAWAVKASEDVYKVDILCEDWTYDVGSGGDIYDWNYFSNDRIAIRDNILINGVSLYDINTKVDDSAYEYTTFPFNASELKQTSYKDSKDYDVFMNPVLLEVKENTLSLLIHKNYVDSICNEFGDELVITIKKEICNSTRISGKVLTEDVTAVAYGIGYDLVLMNGETKVETMSVLAGVALNNLPIITDEYRTFAGWVDAEGNPAPEVMPGEVLTLYAKWNANPYTLTIQYLDETTKTFTFGVEVDEENGIVYTAEDLKAILEENLPENTDEIGYAYVEKIPTSFSVKDYTFTVTTVKVIFTLTFVGENGEDIGVAPMTFTAKTIDDLQLPAVPEKAGYKGTWNKTTDRIKLEDTTLTAVYTEVKEVEDTPTTPETPDSSTDSTDSTTENNGGLLGGCAGVVGGVAGGMVALGVAAIALLKKKED